MTTSEDKSTSLFHDLVELMQKLRSKDGCPWDKELEIPINSRKSWQTFSSILFFTAKLQRRRGSSISEA